MFFIILILPYQIQKSKLQKVLPTTLNVLAEHTAALQKSRGAGRVPGVIFSHSNTLSYPQWGFKRTRSRAVCAGESEAGGESLRPAWDTHTAEREEGRA